MPDPIELVTEEGCFGVTGHMVIIRRQLLHAKPNAKKQVEVESFILKEGSEEEQLKQVDEMREQASKQPGFESFALLKFVSVSQYVYIEEEDEGSKIIKPSLSDTNRLNGKNPLQG